MRSLVEQRREPLDLRLLTAIEQGDELELRRRPVRAVQELRRAALGILELIATVS